MKIDRGFLSAFDKSFNSRRAENKLSKKAKMFDDVREYHQVEQQHTKETMQFKNVVGEYRKICFPYECSGGT